MCERKLKQGRAKQLKFKIFEILFRIISFVFEGTKPILSLLKRVKNKDW